jgi:dihydrodipicolinate synthase/N-acetylneuraminate lyase
MKAITAPRGLIVDLITPFKRDGSIDGRGLGRLLNRVLPHADAVLLSSPKAGEGLNLDQIQRRELLEKAAVVIREKIPILIWVTRETEEDTKETIRALKRGLDKRRYKGPVFWVDAPLYYHSNRGLKSLYHDLCATHREPFILYNDPTLIVELGLPLKRKNIRTAILKELVTMERIVGLVYLGSIDRTHNYQRASRTCSHFRIYDGEESRFLDHPSLSGIISVGANLAPSAWKEITRSSLGLQVNRNNYTEDLRQILRLGRYVRDLMDLYATRPVLLIKALLSEMDIVEPPGDKSGSREVDEIKGRTRELMTENGDYFGTK